MQRLEYYDKLEGDRAEEIPDSLIQIYHTRNGREVIDGRGIEPDEEVDPGEFSRLTATIYAENFVFDYATKFYYANQENPPAKDFYLSEEEYNKFKAYVLEQDFSYSTASEERLKKMKETAEEEGFYEDMQSEYEALLAKVVPSKERDLEKFKSEIKQLLENEIVSRFHYQEGRAVHSFKDDVYLNKAVEIFNNNETYDTILGN